MEIYVPEDKLKVVISDNIKSISKTSSFLLFNHAVSRAFLSISIPITCADPMKVLPIPSIPVPQPKSPTTKFSKSALAQNNMFAAK